MSVLSESKYTESGISKLSVSFNSSFKHLLFCSIPKGHCLTHSFLY